MKNLLIETIEILSRHGKELSDVQWVGNTKFHTTWKNFADIANVEYDNGYGCAEVASDLVIVGDTWWLERHEYDGSEWWEFKERPNLPQEEKEFKRVVHTMGLWNKP